MSALSDMSAPVKLGIAAVVVILVIALILLLDISGMALLVLFLGLVGVVVLLLIFAAILSWRRKRKAKPFEQELAGNTAAVPSNISEASARARLDDLRQKFVRGIETFKSHGKDIYSLPWYAIVGEPGSGKTEALRHSNIGFPPGLQDELQGSGGTINMDWWFTNHAIILDTAGRLMFDEAAESSNPEWVEFLKLLRKHRPNCPINGLMLVIPADSIIRDTADQISDKGGRIARQLDLIQRTLGVRFPVFILVTKADLINGFREFFDELNDPQLQHQIMGWSNPGDLDDQFDPEDVVDHLYTVQERLERRRLGLLLDPISREGAMGKRADEVDALFAFPESLANLAPRLRRYLELIFVSGEWSSKPLFLRGIYFVSSMREGSALDADLAEALGMNVESLPEGRVWERDRSYFLRDLFLMKMFRERGLVTRTSNTAGLKRRRGGILVGATAVFAALLLAVTWFQYRTLRNSIAQPKEFWSAVATTYDEADGTAPVIVGGPQDRDAEDGLVYLGAVAAAPNRLVDDEGENYSTAGALVAVSEQVERPIDVPGIFKPVAWFLPTSSRNLFEEKRLEAGRVAFATSDLRPLVRRALNAIGREGGEWSPAATGALTELVKIYALNDPAAPRASSIQLAPLFEYVLRPEVTEAGNQSAFADASNDLPTLQAAFDRLYTGDGWPGRVIRAAGPDAGDKLAAGIDRYVAFTKRQWQGRGTGSLADAVRLKQAFEAFDAAEQDLVDAYAPAEGAARRDLEPWRDTYPRLGIDAGGSAPYAVMTRSETILEDRDFGDWYRETVEDAGAATTEDLDAILAALPEGGEGAASPPAGAEAVHRQLLDYRSKLEAEKQSFTQLLTTQADDASTVASLEQRLLRRDEPSEPYAYERRAELYRRIEQLRTAARSASDLPQLSLALSTARTDVAELRNRIDTLRPRNRQAPANAYYSAADQVLGLIGQTSETALIDAAVANSPLPKSSREVGQLVTRIVDLRENLSPDPAPPLAMTRWTDGGELDVQFHREAGPEALAMLHGVEARLRDQAVRPDTADQLRSAGRDYLTDYINYWQSVVEREDPFMEYQGQWSRFWGDLGGVNISDVNEELLNLAEVREQALQALDELPGADGWPGHIKDTLAGARTRVRADLGQLNADRDKLDRKCGNWLDFWRRNRLGNIERDRADILQLDESDFRSGALVLYDGGSLGYWQRLTVMGLDVLAAASENITLAAEQTLTELRQFPLKRLSPDAALDQLGEINDATHQQLSWAEVVQARSALNEIKPGIISGDASAAGGFKMGVIGHPDTKFDNPEIDNAIRQMRGRRFRADEQERYNRLAALFRELPADPTARPLRCRISHLGSKNPVAANMGVQSPLPLLTLEWRGADADSREFRLTRGDQELGVEQYPGSDALVFSFTTTAGATTRTSLEVNGPWALFAMLHKFNGRRTDENPKIWEVEVLVPYQQGELSMWLRLEFDTEIPALSEWPQ